MAQCITVNPYVYTVKITHSNSSLGSQPPALVLHMILDFRNIVLFASLKLHLYIFRDICP